MPTRASLSNLRNPIARQPNTLQVSPTHLPRPLQCEYPNSLTNSNPTQSPAWLTSYARQRGRRREGSQRNDGRDWSTGVGAASRVCAGGQPLKDVP